MVFKIEVVVVIPVAHEASVPGGSRIPAVTWTTAELSPELRVAPLPA